MGLIEGLIHHIHYVVFLNNVLPKNDLRSIAKKVLLDQCIASPLFICTFFYCMGFLEGKTLKESTNELKSKMWKVYIVIVLFLKKISVLILFSILDGLVNMASRTVRKLLFYTCTLYGCIC